MNFIFLIPDFNEFPSGGNEYNFQLTTALKLLGKSISLQSYGGLQSWDEHDVIIWDSLYLFNEKNLKKGKHFLLVHHLESLYPPKGWTGQAYFDKKERGHLEQFDGFITSSEYTTAYLKKAGFDEAPIITVLPAMSAKPKAAPKQIDSPIKAIMVSNIVERKGILPFLKELDRKEKPNFELKIIGSLNLEPDYAAKCIDLWQEMEAVKYIGSLSHEAVLKAYSESNLYISTSMMETYGMSIQEASACGLPLLLLHGGNVKNHLKNGNGFLCYSIEELVAQLEELILDENILIQAKNQAVTLRNTPFRSWVDAGNELLSGMGL